MNRGPGLALLALLLAALVAGTQAPYPQPGDGASIRLAWRALGEASLDCRVPTPEELARLPVHMRQREICERRLPTFRLVVVLDGARVVDEEIAPAGASGDRAAVVLREIAARPGRHTIELTFEALGRPAPLKRLRREFTLSEGDVALILEDSADRGLTLRLPGD